MGGAYSLAAQTVLLSLSVKGAAQRRLVRGDAGHGSIQDVSAVEMLAQVSRRPCRRRSVQASDEIWAGCRAFDLIQNLKNL